MIQLKTGAVTAFFLFVRDRGRGMTFRASGHAAALIKTEIVQVDLFGLTPFFMTGAMIFTSFSAAFVRLSSLP